ncbi:MAG: hypothetical protein LBS30_07710 [Planctomycetota bacterium]|nr:hypothetical protein [Planctomycetota bacterium]
MPDTQWQSYAERRKQSSFVPVSSFFESNHELFLPMKPWKKNTALSVCARADSAVCYAPLGVFIFSVYSKVKIWMFRQHLSDFWRLEI